MHTGDTKAIPHIEHATELTFINIKSFPFSMLKLWGGVYIYASYTFFNFYFP